MLFKDAVVFCGFFALRKGGTADVTAIALARLQIRG
jgi:hypothetical protein